MESAQERRSEVLIPLDGYKDNTTEIVNPIQQTGNSDVGITVVRVLDRGAFADEGVGFVEKENCFGTFRGIEYFAQIFFGFADVFVDDSGEIAEVKGKLEFVSHHLGRK